MTEVKIRIESILGTSEATYRLKPKVIDGEAVGWDLWTQSNSRWNLKTIGAIYARGATKEEAIQKLLNSTSDYEYSRELISVKDIR